MSRVYFQRLESGYRAVRGEVVRRVQLELKAAGSDPGEVDGRKTCPHSERCLQLTGDLEGHGFQTIVGNFDDAELTWGITGFTLKHDEIQKILTEIKQNNLALLDQVFGNLKDKLIRVLQQELSEQLDWAASISIGVHRYLVEHPWEDAFYTLCTFPEVQRIQLQRVE